MKDCPWRKSALITPCDPCEDIAAGGSEVKQSSRVNVWQEDTVWIIQHESTVSWLKCARDDTGCLQFKSLLSIEGSAGAAQGIVGTRKDKIHGESIKGRDGG